MPVIGNICELLERLAPVELAEEWDNVGLLVGDHSRAVQRLMTCLTLTQESVTEAVEMRADLVVTHHPLPFRPLSRITRDTTVGGMLLDLIADGVAVYSAHTAFDSAHAGINEQLAEAIGLQNIEPLRLTQTSDQLVALGAGRCGLLHRVQTLNELAGRLKNFLGLSHARIVGDPERPLERVALACGSGGSFLPAARDRECDCLVTGETNFHTCLEAKATGVALVLCGHFSSERFALEWLAQHLSTQLPGVDCWCSRRERDPLVWV